MNRYWRFGFALLLFTSAFRGCVSAGESTIYSSEASLSDIERDASRIVSAGAIVESLSDRSLGTLLRVRLIEGLRPEDLAKAPIVAALNTCASDPDNIVSSAATAALFKTKLPPERYHTLLRGALSSKQPSLQQLALDRITVIGQPNVAVAAEVASLIDSNSAEVRAAAIRAASVVDPSEKTAARCSVRLKDESVSVRLAVLQALRSTHLAAYPQIEAVHAALQDRSFSVRAEALQTLGAWGPVSAGSVKAIVSRLQDPISTVRVQAIECLKSLGPVAVRELLAVSDPSFVDQAALVKPALSVLAGRYPQEFHAALKTGSDRDRISIFQAFSECKPPHPESLRLLINAALDSSLEVQRVSTQALVNLQRWSLPWVIEASKHGPSKLRLHAIQTLEKMNSGAAPAIPMLVDLLQDTDNDIRTASARALGAIGVDAAMAAPALIHALKEKQNVTLCAAAIQALADIDGVSEFALLELVPMLDSSNESIRGSLAAAFVRAKEPATASSLLTLLLKDPMVPVRRAAAIAALDLKGAFDLPREQLCNIVMTDVPEVRVPAARALGRLGDHPISASAFSVAIGHKHPHVRAAVVSGIGESQELAGKCIETLSRAMRDEDVFVRRSAMATLAKSGSAGLNAVAVALDDPNPELRLQALDALLQETDSIHNCIPALNELLISGKHFEAGAVLSIIQRMKVRATPLLPALLVAIEKHPGKTHILLESIGEMGVEAAPAIPFLMEKLEVKKAATSDPMIVRTLVRIGPAAAIAVAGLLPEKDKRESALLVLGEFATVPAEVLPLVTEYLNVPKSRDAFIARRIIARAGQLSIPTLQTLLNDQDERVLLHTYWIIEKLGGDALELAPALLQKLNEKPEPALISCLSKMGEPLIGLLREGLAGTGLKTQAAYAEILARMHARGHEGQKLLMEIAGRGDPAFSAAILAGLQTHESPSDANMAVFLVIVEKSNELFLPQLVDSFSKMRERSRVSELLRSSSKFSKIVGIAVLGKEDSSQGFIHTQIFNSFLKDTDARIQLETLKSIASRRIVECAAGCFGLLKSEHEHIRKAAKDALLKIGSIPVSGMPALEAALLSDNDEIKLLALQLLSNAGPRGAPLLRRALQSLRHASAHVRDMAMIAISSITCYQEADTEYLKNLLVDGSFFERRAVFLVLQSNTKLVLNETQRTSMNEMRALDAVRRICDAQIKYQSKDWDEDGKFEYAASFKGNHSLLEAKSGAEDLFLIPREIAVAEGLGVGEAEYHGYRFFIAKKSLIGANWSVRALSQQEKKDLTEVAIVAYPVKASAGKYAFCGDPYMQILTLEWDFKERDPSGPRVFEKWRLVTNEVLTENGRKKAEE